MGNSSKRGFASMPGGQQREIASKGGIAAHQKGTAHEFTSAEAKMAGHKGGIAAQKSGHAHELTEEERSEGGSHSGGNFKNDPSRAAEAGRKGGSH